MPINTDLNIAPYFDDFDVEKQFYKILFKPAYAVQARELTQLQTILQNQIEQFGDNIYQEGSIIKGCNFTTLNGLEYVKVKDGIDVLSYISGKTTEIISGIETEVDVVYELEAASGLKANIISATRGFETRAPELNTFYINYLNSETGYSGSTPQKFSAGQSLVINRYKYIGTSLYSTEPAIVTINVTNLPDPTGKSFGIRASQGVIFQKGHFLFADDQTLVVSKYTDQPDDISVGYEVSEFLVTALQDRSLFDNANGSSNENAPGADRLKLVPVLVAKTTSVADLDPAFFTLIRYQNGSAVQLRDVSQFNSIAEELAKRTYEESGNYIVDRFKISFDRRDTDLIALVGKGTAYVKGYRVSTSGKQDFVIDQVQNTAIQQNQATTIDYGNYVTVEDVSGKVDLGYVKADLRNGGGTKIGECFVRNITENRIYLFGVTMTGSNEFSAVEAIKPTAAGSGQINIAAGSVLKEGLKAPLIFPTGSLYVKETTDISIPVRTQESVSVTSDTIVLTAGIGEDFALNQDDMVFVDDSNTLIPILSYSTSNNNSTLTINLAPGSDPAGELYYNKRITNAEPYSKQSVMPYVKVNHLSTKTKYSLGFPDVYKILDIYDSTGTRYTDSFKLYENHKDHYYDISYMEYIPGRPVPPDGVLTIKLAVFQVNSSAGQYFFTINSYPVDDVTDPLPAGKIRSYDIDTYRATNGIVYNLRNCYDFRPYVDRDPVVNYTHTSASSAGVVIINVGAYNTTFSAGSYVVPPLNSNITSDIESYLSRVDVITADSYGKINIFKGEESETPAPPAISADEMIVSEILIPGYPALSPKEAADSGKLECAIKVKPRGTRNYTMRDIEKIEKRIEGLEYYISLSQLEAQAENLLVLDENGLTRFKNGYIVDPFNDSRVANTLDPHYKAAIQFDRKILTPAVNTFPLDLRYKSGSSASIFPSVNEAEVATLSRNAHVKLLGQPYATNVRNCVSNFWKYAGQGTLSPDHDMIPSVTENPVPFNIDITSIFQDLNEQFPLTATNWSGREETAGSTVITSGRTTTTITNVIERGTATSLNVNDGGLNRVGDFVTNLEFEPYMRSRDVRIHVAGLRPNTRHYFFFDQVAVDQWVWKGTEADNARSVQKFGSAGDAVTTDVNGVLTAVFTIPEGRFFVGDRVLTVVDVSQYSSIDSASTSKAELVYHAYNISVEKTTISTRIPEFSTTTNNTTRNLPARVTSFTEADGGGDPLAQTFFIKAGMGRGSNSVFISKIDLYFKRKSDTNGVTITLREVVNGYPSGQVLPFSKKHLTSAEVEVSDDATLLTEVLFDAPVRMDVEKEYAIVIMPDANDPNYLHFTSKVGGTDLTAGPTQGQSVVMDWGDGVLFTSTNNRAWQSVQDEDIKFTLYRHSFNAASGTVTLTNADHEFLTLSDWDGRFNQEEIVYKVHAPAYTVSIVQNTNIVTQSGNDFNLDYVAGDYILIKNNAATLSDIFRVASVDSSTQMTLDKPCSFNGANGTGTQIVAGIVTHYNKFNRSEMHLKNSSANATKFFEAGDVVIGFTSGTQGTIGSVNNINLSYVQPFIQKSNDSVTNTTLSGVFNNPANVLDNYSLQMKFGDNNTFTRYGVVVYSKSNNLVNPKPFDIVVGMTNSGNETSTPIVDLELSSLLAYQYKVTDDSATTSKYISKTVELAEDLDAEDMQVILTGHRPNGTDIKVYIRPQNVNDGSAFDEIDWIELELFEGINTYASAANPNDWREYKYRVADANKNGGGVITYSSSSGTFSSYRKFAIKIELLAENINIVPFVKDYRGIALT